MTKSDHKPPDEELKKRRKLRYILDPKDVSKKDEARIRAWALEIMQANEHKFTNKWKDRDIVASGTLKPESVDVGAIYIFPELQWYIYKDGAQWSIMLMSKHRMLAKLSYAKI